MSEEIKAMVADLMKATEGNPEAKAFLEGLAAGITHNPNLREGENTDAEKED